jgi:hypothetical protein
MSPPTLTFDIDTMTDLCHNALVAELQVVSRLPVTDRVALANRRRRTQLERYTVYERQSDSSTSKNKNQVTLTQKDDTRRPQTRGSSSRRRKRPDSVTFAGSVKLLEATTRNDLDEG